jgi:hypothetical protein
MKAHLHAVGGQRIEQLCHAVADLTLAGWLFESLEDLIVLLTVACQEHIFVQVLGERELSR